MTKDQLIEKLISNIKSGITKTDENIMSVLDTSPNMKAIIDLIADGGVPKYSFALREDIKDQKEFLPTRAETKATGWDVRAAFTSKNSLILRPFQYAKIPLGFRAFCPEGWWFELKPRSSSFTKKNLHALYGTIDETYEGEMVFACQYIPTPEYPEYQGDKLRALSGGGGWDKFNKEISLEINFGDAIGQLIPVRRQEMKVVELSNDEYNEMCQKRNGIRGAGGFGSTGT